MCGVRSKGHQARPAGAPSERCADSGPRGRINRVPSGSRMDFANGSQSFSDEQSPCSRTTVGGPSPPLVIADSLGTRGGRSMALAATRIPRSPRKVLHCFMCQGPNLRVRDFVDARAGSATRRLSPSERRGVGWSSSDRTTRPLACTGVYRPGRQPEKLSTGKRQHQIVHELPSGSDPQHVPRHPRRSESFPAPSTWLPAATAVDPIRIVVSLLQFEGPVERAQQELNLPRFARICTKAGSSGRVQSRIRHGYFLSRSNSEAWTTSETTGILWTTIVRHALRRASALPTRRWCLLQRLFSQFFKIAQPFDRVHRNQTKVGHKFGAWIAPRVGYLGKIALRKANQMLHPAHGCARSDLAQSLVQAGPKRSLKDVLESFVDGARRGRVHPFSTAVVASWNLYVRWDLQHQSPISLLSSRLGHRNNSARTTLVASSCYLHRHSILIVFIIFAASSHRHRLRRHFVGLGFTIPPFVRSGRSSG